MTKENKPAIRFFIADDNDGTVCECSESDFLGYDANIKYERHTVRENGCDQICLTKTNWQ